MLATVDGWPINVSTQQQAVEEIVSAAEKRDSFAAWTLNMDFLVKLRTNMAFRESFSSARFVMADGAPLVRLARKQGVRIERTTGADLVVPLVHAAAAHGLPIYLFGTSPEVLGKAGSQLSSWTDNKIDIVGTEAPSKNFDPRGPEADAALDRIAASRARLCFLALGAPKQEVLAARAVERGIPAGFVCIGAALDFIAGAQLRAPVAFQRNGFEWLWRLATNPRRLFVRYVKCALVYLELMVVNRLALRNAR